ncbi:response regulator receiver domain-containing protein [Pacificibacter maritimus]|uniref:Response regulator receiver domain-containing protein n=1 Tax=Pacificibacter maritimus TaxID=762213 RepID=A0A3N4UTV4_9RHOB|nr:response regulator receiver domain-containing protein [Pacificibacter maritimus]
MPQILFTFHVARNDVESFDLVTALFPDIIIADVHVPRLDGFDFIKVIRRDTGNRPLPILVQSGEQFSEPHDLARQTGANGWHRKLVTLSPSSSQRDNALHSEKVMP